MTLIHGRYGLLPIFYQQRFTKATNKLECKSRRFGVIVTPKTINNKSRIISILLTKKIIISDNILAQTESVFSFGDGLNLRMTLSINKNVN